MGRYPIINTSKKIIFLPIVLIVIAVVLGAYALTIINSGDADSENGSVQTAEPVVSPAYTPEVTAHPVFDHATDGGLGPEIFQPSEFPGTVETLEYPTTDYNSGYGTSIKAMRVYLPYNYDENRKYNVLVLLHGSGGNERYWFDEVKWYNDPDYMNCYECYLATVIDNMIANNLCEPLIVVSPTFYYSNSWRMAGDLTSRDAYQFKKELRNDILPALKNHYSVYDIGDREHYGFIGASHGAEICYNGILSNDLDLFSWYGAISGFEGNVYDIEWVWQNSGFDNLGISYFYTSAGENDYTLQQTYDGYLQMKNYSSKIDENNSDYIQIRVAGHEDIVWIDGVYNCLLKFFRM